MLKQLMVAVPSKASTLKSLGTEGISNVKCAALAGANICLSLSWGIKGELRYLSLNRLKSAVYASRAANGLM